MDIYHPIETCVAAMPVEDLYGITLSPSTAKDHINEEDFYSFAHHAARRGLAILRAAKEEGFDRELAAKGYSIMDFWISQAGYSLHGRSRFHELGGMAALGTNAEELVALGNFAFETEELAAELLYELHSSEHNM